MVVGRWSLVSSHWSFRFADLAHRGRSGFPTATYFLRMSSITKKKLLLLAATISLVTMILLTPYYRYISSDLPKDMKFIFLHWNNSPEEKYQLRFGATFSLLNNIVNHTPPDAIIIMPPD